jgi:F-type H+-transporting ATPase subunit b
LKQARVLFLLAVMLLVYAAVAWASGGEQEEPNWKNFIYRTINFVAVFGVIWYVAGKKIANTFSGRKLGIKNQLADLDERKENAKKRLSEVEKSIAALENEKAKILEDFRTQGEALKASIIAAAEAQAEKIKAQALVSAEQEVKTAMAALRSEVADKIVEAAQAMLVQKLTADDQDKLVDAALSKVVLN